MAGIYLHVPFCKQACTYCDFHFSTNLRHLPDVAETLLTEIDLRQAYLPDKLIESIYFGGGTPSLLPVNTLERIVGRLNHFYTWENDVEVTLEANPDDIHPAILKVWRNVGINRLSIGLQSFSDEELRWMNRAHNAEESLRAVKMAQDAGFDNITIDLIYGSKFQSLATWEKTLITAIGLNTQHVSAYNLTIEEKTPLGVNYLRGKEPLVNEELSSRQFEMMSQMLCEAGFEHYEISNFGKKGFIARHNSNYWKGLPYMGIGPSAHSFNGASRQWNVKSNARYIQLVREGAGFFELEYLSGKDRYNEYVLTRLRTIWGCDLAEMKSLFGEDICQHFRKEIKKHEGLFREIDDVFVLNEAGRLKADGIASDLFLL